MRNIWLCKAYVQSHYHYKSWANLRQTGARSPKSLNLFAVCFFWNSFRAANMCTQINYQIYIAHVQSATSSMYQSVLVLGCVAAFVSFALVWHQNNGQELNKLKVRSRKLHFTWKRIRLRADERPRPSANGANRESDRIRTHSLIKFSGQLKPHSAVHWFHWANDTLLIYSTSHNLIRPTNK